jgi:DNA polymerase III subunit gamma/tau
LFFSPSFAIVEGFVVSARKYRPATFDSVVGQSHVTNTLKNAIKMGQLAHAFLFSGPRGVGKTTCARILAKAINCMNPPEDGEACNACESCVTFNEGRSLNIHELDAASNNSVEDIRKIIDQVRYVPAVGKKSIFIIDEVHMLSSAAFNAFLKTLEEPPAHAIFILATTEKHKILPTILSRVQKFDFKRIKVDAVAEHLKSICEKEGIQYEFDALQLIGLKADGGLRDGLSIFDQIVSFSNRHVTYKIVVENLNVLDYAYYFKAVEMMMAADYEGLLVMLNEVIDLGFEVKDFLVGLTEHFRNLLIARTPKTIALLETSDNVKRQYTEQVQTISATVLLNAFNLASTAEQAMRNAASPRLHVELALMKLAHLQHAIALAQDSEKKKPSDRVGAQNLSVSAPQAVSAEVPTAEDKPFNPLNPEVKRTRIMKGSFAMPKNLDAIDHGVLQKKANDEDDADAFIVYDERVVISKDVFEAAYTKMLDMFNADGRYRIATLLRQDAYELDHNKWVQSVPSEVVRKQLADERHVIEYMRLHTGVSNLLLEIKIVEMGINPNDARPYTNEEKLDQMLTKNPALRQLMKKFDAHVKYE